MPKTILKKTYIDVTDTWLEKAKPNSHKIKFDNFFLDANGIQHPILGKEMKHEIPTKGDEYQKAFWLKSTFGGKIHLVPRITDISNSGLSTPTPDYIWNNEAWDLKTPTLNGKFQTAIERFMKQPKMKRQANRFIIDFKNYKNRTDKEIIDLAMITLNNPYRYWIESIILVKNKRLIKIYTKQKEPSSGNCPARSSM